MFDLLVLAVLCVSALIGFFRGATRELVAVIALIAGVVAGILSLRFSAPIVQSVIETEWLASAIAILIVFLIVYILVRLIGGGLAKRVHETELGSVDRAVGLGFGLVRALVILGVFNLVFHAATPPERTPAWVTNAWLYPLTAISADTLRALAPRGMMVADQIRPALEGAVEGSGETSPTDGGDKPAEDGYDAETLRKLDDLVEKSL